MCSAKKLLKRIHISWTECRLSPRKLEFGLRLACAWVPYTGVADFTIHFFTQWTPYIQVFVLGQVRVHSL